MSLISGWCNGQSPRHMDHPEGCRSTICVCACHGQMELPAEIGPLAACPRCGSTDLDRDESPMAVDLASVVCGRCDYGWREPDAC